MKEINVDIKTVSKKAVSGKTKQRNRSKFFDVFGEVYNPVRSEKAVWTAVITQAIMDALSKSKNAEAQYLKSEAIRWLLDNSADFNMVCMLADKDPDNVRTRAKRALSSPTPWRAEAGKGKRYLERKAYRKKQKAKPEIETPVDSDQEKILNFQKK